MLHFNASVVIISHSDGDAGNMTDLLPRPVNQQMFINS